MAAAGFSWLVGESELQVGEVQVGPEQVRSQRSIVHIKKCRYLESSGCVGMCVNMCKVGGQGSQGRRGRAGGARCGAHEGGGVKLGAWIDRSRGGVAE